MGFGGVKAEVLAKEDGEVRSGDDMVNVRRVMRTVTAHVMRRAEGGMHVTRRRSIV